MNSIVLARSRLIALLGAAGLLAGAGVIAMPEAAHADTPASCASASVDESGPPGVEQFTADEQAFYNEDIAVIANDFGLALDQACEAGWWLIDTGAKAVVEGAAKSVLLGESEPRDITKDVFEMVWDAAIHAVEQEQAAEYNPLLIPVGPVIGSEPVAATLTISDAYLGGAWGRGDSSDPSWHDQNSPPAGPAVFYGNGEQVSGVCTLPGATYEVHYLDGSIAQWGWWVKTADDLWVPAAQFAEITSPDQPNLPLCGDEVNRVG